METRIGASVFAAPSEIRHSVINGTPALTFGEWPSVSRVDVYFNGTDDIDAAIAHLVALRADMTAPVITDSERDCDRLNPDGDWPCHRSGPHAEHRDANGGTWTTAAGADPAPRPLYRLACGCPDDWCECGKCETEPHQAGDRWFCQEHGWTTVAGAAAVLAGQRAAS